MQINSPHCKIPTAIAIALMAALLAASVSSTALAAPYSSNGHFSTPHRHLALAGGWSGKYGGAFSGTFTLHWKQTGSNLRGSITLSNPPGAYTVTGSVNGSAIKFGAVTAGATYAGSVSGKTMSGSYTTPRGGGTWSAHKTS